MADLPSQVTTSKRYLRLVEALCLLMIVGSFILFVVLSSGSNHEIGTRQIELGGPTTSKVQMSFSYKVVGVGGYLSGPTLSFLLNGSVQTATLTTVPSSYLLDMGSIWNITKTLPGSNSTIAWIAGTPTSGKATNGVSIVVTYSLHFSVAFGYKVIGTSSGFPPPKVVYYTFGSKASATVPSVVWVDPSSAYSYTSVVTSSTTGARLATVEGTGNITAPSSVVVVYYHQVLVSFGYAVLQGGNPPQPVLISESFGQYQYLNLTNTASSLWLDQFSKYSASRVLPSNTLGQRWLAGPISEGSVSVPVNILVPYYNQFGATAYYSLVGGGAPSVIGLSGYSANAAVTYSLSTFPQVLWFDANSGYSLSSSIGPSNGERWIAPGTNSGVVSGPFEVTPTFYHQYLFSLSAKIEGNTSSPLPWFGYYAEGVASNSTLKEVPTQFWVDARTSFRNEAVLGGSTNDERWATPLVGGVASQAVSETVTYFHQYNVVLEYAWAGQAASDPRSFQAVQFGQVHSLMVSTAALPTVWIDAGSTWTAEQNISGSTGTRWVAVSADSGTVDSPATVTLSYQEQFQVSISSTSSLGGTTSPDSGWYDAGSQVPLSASAYNGWKFISWIGQGGTAYTGSENSHGMILGGPVVEMAQFYASVTFSVEPGGSLYYSAGNGTRVIPGGQPTVRYVQPGTALTLRATPSSLLSVFEGWTGTITTSANPVSIVVSSPATIKASFGTNLLAVYAILGLGAVAFVGLALSWFMGLRLPVVGELRSAARRGSKILSRIWNRVRRT